MAAAVQQIPEKDDECLKDLLALNHLIHIIDNHVLNSPKEARTWPQ